HRLYILWSGYRSLSCYIARSVSRETLVDVMRSTNRLVVPYLRTHTPIRDDLASTIIPRSPGRRKGRDFGGYESETKLIVPVLSYAWSERLISSASRERPPQYVHLFSR